MSISSFLTLAFLISFALPLGCSQSQNVEASTQDDEIVAFADVNVIPMDTERVLETYTVIVQDGVITEMGPSASVEIPQGARVLDGRGAYLLPGLTDFHIHLRSTDELISYLAYGVTTVVHLSDAQPGAPDLLRYRDQLASGEMLGPRLLMSGPMLDGDPPIWPNVSVVVTTPEEARNVVVEQKQAGYDFIKVYNNLPPEALEAATATAHEQGMAVVGHIPRGAGRDQALQRALEANQDMFAHGEEYFFTYFYSDVDSLLDLGEVPFPDETRITQAVRMTRAAGTAVTPNLSFVAMTRRQLDDIEAVLADPETRYLHPDVLTMWRTQNFTHRPDLERFDKREQAKYPFLRKLTKALNDAGVPLLLGTDASFIGLFPGKSAHVELREMVEAGLTPYEALKTGTRNAGGFIGDYVSSAEPFGLVAPGQRADLILVQGNPMEDISTVSNIEGVMVRGRWLTSAELQQAREEVAASYGR